MFVSQFGKVLNDLVDGVYRVYDLSHFSDVFVFLSELVFKLLLEARVNFGDSFDLMLNLLHLLILEVQGCRHLLNPLPFVFFDLLHLSVDPCLLVLQLFIFVFKIDETVSKPLNFAL